MTTNRKLSITWIAIYMFARWCQGNFFKYLRQEYDIDRMMYYIVKQINQLKAEEQKLVARRKQQPYKIEVKDMPEDTKYTKLDMEGKLFQNIIKMICYRAETTVSLLLKDETYKKQEEIRSLLKSIIKSKGDILPDYQQKTLTIKLYTLSTPRDNRALEKLCELLTSSETIYPGTELRLIYKLATNCCARDQEI